MRIAARQVSVAQAYSELPVRSQIASIASSDRIDPTTAVIQVYHIKLMLTKTATALSTTDIHLTFA